MSPYENLLRQEAFRRVGLCALVKPGKEEQLQAVAKSTSGSVSVTLRNMHAYLGRLDGYTVVFVYLETFPTDLDTVPERLQHLPQFRALTPCLETDPRKGGTGTPWMRMEMINVVGPTRPEVAPQAQHLGYVSRLRPDHELTYRTLHQTNWPGVIDQMARSNYRYWVTFLIEIGNDLTLFTYCQYVGQDKTTDDRAIADDPTTRRWWRHTQPCLHAPVGCADSWLPLPTLQDTEIPTERTQPVG